MKLRFNFGPSRYVVVYNDYKTRERFKEKKFARRTEAKNWMRMAYRSNRYRIIGGPFEEFY